MMEKISKNIVKHKKTIILTFLVITLISAVLSFAVGVNYNLSSYLPDTSKSTIALDKMKEEYNTDVPNTRVLIKNVSIAKALEYKEKLSEIDGVKEINWLDDSISINEPIEFADKDTVETWYKDKNALFSLVVDENKQVQAIDDIRKMIGDENAMSGDSVNTVMAEEATSKEINKILMIVIPLVFLILLLTTDSYFEPVLFLASIGVAIIINRGTNILLGEISFVTNAAQSLIQLAVSMDYSIFLLHRFMEERKTNENIEEAMQQALIKSVGSISSSALTTIIGFAALMFMKFKIGIDMGIVMSKSIVISLITIMTFLPAMTMYCYKLIDKTRHNMLFKNFNKFAKIVQKAGLPILIIFLMLIVPSRLASDKITFLYGASKMFKDEQAQINTDREEIEDLFGKSNQLVLMVPKGDLAKEKLLTDDLKENKNINSVISYINMVGSEIPMEYVPENSLSMLISKNYSRMVISIDCDAEGDKTFKTINDIEKTAGIYYDKDKIYICGESPSTYDLMNTVQKDNKVVNSISMLAIFLVLLFNFKSVSIAAILLFVIKVAIWINFSIPYFRAEQLNYISYLIISAIQLGATVDYAILYASRYLENRQIKDKKDAILSTINDTTLSILTSASIMILAGFMLGFGSGNKIISEVGMLLGKGTLCSTLLVLFVLPKLLTSLDKVIQKTSLGLKLKEEL